MNKETFGKLIETLASFLQLPQEQLPLALGIYLDELQIEYEEMEE